MTVIHGDCLEAMRAMEPNSVDAIVCDPPYGLEFMGKEWDSFKTYNGGNPNMKPQGVAVAGRGDGEWRPGTSYGGRSKNARCRNCGKLKFQRESGKCKCPTPQWDTRTNESAYQFQCFMEDWARECWRVAKPGAHLVAFGGTRTFHRLACAIEDAGWEIRDTLSWMYGSGFPKSKNIGGGFGTALKPGWEPIILARKPLAGTVAATVSQYGTGALNIDGCRIAAGRDNHDLRVTQGGANCGVPVAPRAEVPREFEQSPLGRWPANVVLSHAPECNGACAPDCPVRLLDEQSGERRSRGSINPSRSSVEATVSISPKVRQCGGEYTYGDTGGASRFYYTAKASRREREAGLEGMPVREYPVAVIQTKGVGLDGQTLNGKQVARSLNHHPTVKPLALMRWLCRLVTPPGGLILDPFTGSGSTGCAAVLEGFRFIGIEQSEEYVAIAERRIAHWAATAAKPDTQTELEVA